MRLVDARRLTGPNHLSRAPLVIVEIALEPSESAGAACDAYRGELRRMRAAFGLEADVPMLTRLHHGGAVFGYEAPVDAMLACAEMSEWAVESAAEVMAGRPPCSVEPKRVVIAEVLERDRNPRLVALAAEARRRDVPFLWDDDVVSLGTGKRSTSFPKAELPDLASVAWETLGAIPTVLVTGTNGKTTSSRLLARIATEAGLRVGTTSTDGITVGSELLEDGDWTGPAAARIVLRRADVDLAVLETARGGILRRGLAVDTCDAALVTNVSDDHIGLYGIDDVEAMARGEGRRREGRERERHRGAQCARPSARSSRRGARVQGDLLRRSRGSGRRRPRCRPRRCAHRHRTASRARRSRRLHAGR